MIRFSLVLPILLMASPAHSAGKAANTKLESRLIEFEKAYLSRDLTSFWNPWSQPFKVTIIHSLTEPPKGAESYKFLAFWQFEELLRKREHGGQEPGSDLLPNRMVRSRSLKRAGVVEYNVQGISHNTLYLWRIRYSTKGRDLFFNEIVLYDGD
jgi:hypothetical protein